MFIDFVQRLGDSAVIPCETLLRCLYVETVIWLFREELAEGKYLEECGQLVANMKSAYGFVTDDVYQGENLSPVIDELEGLIKDGKVIIGDNDLLKIHFLDSALKQNAETMRKRLVKVSNNVHIDGMAAVLDGMTVRQKWFNEIGGQLANE